MRRLPGLLAAFAALGLSVPAVAQATLLPAQPAHLTGSIVSTDPYSLVVQAPGRPVGVISALTSAANRLQSGNYPYVWGGGHAEAGVASVGEAGGPGFNGRRRGYDCSGSVAAVLSAAGLWPAGAAVPNDAGVIGYLLRARLIAPGAGTGAGQVTLYDDPGVHIFMSINGRFFGTSDGGMSGNAHGGPGWLDVGGDVTSRAFRRYHFLPNVLSAKTTAGFTFGFELGVGLGLVQYPAGTQVTVTYRTTASGMLVAENVAVIGETMTTGTIQAIGPAGATLTLVASDGTALTLDVSAGSQLAQELADGQAAVGDTVTAGYLGSAPAPLTLIALTVNSTPGSTTTTTTTTTTTSTTTTTVTAPTPTTQTQTSPVPQSYSNNSGGSGW